MRTLKCRLFSKKIIMENREIKFRAWDKKNKWMCHVGSLNTLRDDIVSVESVEVYPLDDKNINNSNDCWYKLWSQDFIIRQFTGLKDKNGKEIFEGDIVEKDLGKGLERFEVVWDSGSFHIAINGKIIDYLCDNAKSSEIVGNIFENKDLQNG